MTLERVQGLALENGLTEAGAFHPDTGEWATIILLAPAPNFWTRFKESPEGSDGIANPIDTWSRRVIGALAQELSATALFPFEGPPYYPFLDYAKQSAQAFSSPVGMVVHSKLGLMISYRGALAFHVKLSLPESRGESPCKSCAEQPCKTACPVDAFAGGEYNVRACRDFLDTEAGQTCLRGGCKVRLACPISASAGRSAEQSAYHMRVFKNSG